MHTDIRFDVLQLSRWNTDRDALLGSALGSWFYFFNEAERWREVPDLIDTGVMEEAMEVLNGFRADVQLNHLYRGRLEAARAEKERERAEKDAALTELAALRATMGRSPA